MSIWARHKIFETNSIVLVVGVLLVVFVVAAPEGILGLAKKVLRR